MQIKPNCPLEMMADFDCDDCPDQYSYVLVRDYMDAGITILMECNGSKKTGKADKMIDLVHGDCMEYMKGLPDKAVVLAVVDPPYGINAETFNLRTNCHIKLKSSWVDVKPDKLFFEELQRISVEQIIWGGNYFCHYLVENNNWIVWYKNNDGVSFSMAELAWCSIRKNIKVFKYRPMGKLNKIHPTQKPVALYEWLLTNYAKPGDTILDTHLGSGSSDIAAYNLGFDFVGIEIDKGYYDAAVNRFESHKRQYRLFEPEQAKREEQMKL